MTDLTSKHLRTYHGFQNYFNQLKTKTKGNYVRLPGSPDGCGKFMIDAEIEERFLVRYGKCVEALEYLHRVDYEKYRRFDLRIVQQGRKISNLVFDVDVDIPWKVGMDEVTGMLPSIEKFHAALFPLLSEMYGHDIVADLDVY